MTKWAAAVVAIALVGCGSDVDLSGYYEVSYHTQSDTSCNTEGPDAIDPIAYFKLTKEEFFGQEYFAFSECDTTDEATCSGGGLFFGLSFQEPIDNGWRGQVSAASGFDTSCTLSYSESSAILQESGDVRIEVRMWTEDVTVANQDECKFELAEERGTSMPCGNFEVILGLPI